MKEAVRVRLESHTQSPGFTGTITGNSGGIVEFFVERENGARYLDPKTSRWISADPAMGEYIPVAPINDEAKKHNQNLPGMGGIFNLVNMHTYHYAGNNPIKLIDPDGRSPKSYKTIHAGLSFAAGHRVEVYIFSASISTIDGASEAAFSGIIPFGLGSLAQRGISSLFSFRNISSKDGLTTLKNIFSTSSSILSQSGRFSSLIRATGNLAKVLEKVGKFAGLVSYGITVIDVVYQLTRADSVGMDTMIERLLGPAMYSKTHEGLSALYLYAKHEMASLRANGGLSFSTDATGAITSSSFSPEKIDALKDELRTLRIIIDGE